MNAGKPTPKPSVNSSLLPTPLPIWCQHRCHPQLPHHRSIELLLAALRGRRPANARADMQNAPGQIDRGRRGCSIAQKMIGATQVQLVCPVMHGVAVPVLGSKTTQLLFVLQQSPVILHD